MKPPSRSGNERAFTLIALLVIVAMLAVLAGMLLPALAKAKARAQRINCVNNLKMSGLSFRQWALDNDDKYPMHVPVVTNGTMEYVEGGNAYRHFQALSNELDTPKILVCASDNRKPANRFEDLKNQNVSYFVGLDASEPFPARFLAGDRNITNGTSPIRTVLYLRPNRPAGWTEAIHNNMGNVGLADGSVQGFTTPALREGLRSTGDVTNRIALPE